MWALLRKYTLLQSVMMKLEKRISKVSSTFVFRRNIQNCADVLEQGHTTSGVYNIYLSRAKKFIPVFCDMETDGGGWLVFQRRTDGSVSFVRDWDAYKAGFGNVSAEFWFGNDHLYDVTYGKHYTLRVDLEDFENEKRYALYSQFEVASERSKYKLTLGSYDGTAGDALSDCAGQSFSTKDSDNDSKGDGHCSSTYKGGWWYNNCHIANLNGLYLGGAHASFADGIDWQPWRGYHYSLKKVDMKLRP
ncbi:Ryncolin-4 [Lamellibrachia satsuma]|nr:Ryncolin-4 [Lamellibrachia satsuma]